MVSTGYEHDERHIRRRLAALLIVLVLAVGGVVALEAPHANAGMSCTNTSHQHYYEGLGYEVHWVYNTDPDGTRYWRAAWSHDMGNYWYLGSNYCPT